MGLRPLEPYVHKEYVEKRVAELSWGWWSLL